MKMIFTAFALLLALSSYPQITYSQEAETATVVGGAAEMNEAVTLATAYVKTKSIRKGEYRLIATRNLLSKGTHVWLVTFKSTNTIPEDPTTAEIGMGGELFVTVDLKEKKCTLRYGE